MAIFHRSVAVYRTSSSSQVWGIHWHVVFRIEGWFDLGLHYMQIYVCIYIYIYMYTYKYIQHKLCSPAARLTSCGLCSTSIKKESPTGNTLRPNMGSDISLGLKMGDTYPKCPLSNREYYTDIYRLYNLDYQSVGVYTLFLPPYAEQHLIANISWRSSSKPKRFASWTCQEVVMCKRLKQLETMRPGSMFQKSPHHRLLPHQ